MTFIKISKGWEIPERLVTPEAVYLNRRKFLKSLGMASMTAWSAWNGFFTRISRASTSGDDVSRTIPTADGVYPAPRNTKYKVNRPLTDELTAASYNNFYEFTTQKDQVWKLAEQFETHPWQIEVSGQVHQKKTFDMDDLLKKIPLEERIYRLRCVEAWSMVVPWTGFSFRKLMTLVRPTSQAKYVRMVSFLRPHQAPGQKYQPWYPWPYFEGLTIEEADNELTLFATGIYGHALPKQHGAPLRLIVPWKYGFKSIKSIVKIEFLSKPPPSFWNEVSPEEYDFWANVNPGVPHQRWSQAMERVIDTGERIPTRLYNGYEKYVAHLYP